MRIVSVISASAVSLALASTAPAQALPRVGMSVTPYAGYMIFGDFITGPVGTSIANASGPVFGAQLGVDLVPGVSLIGNVARASSDLQVGLPVIGGISVGKSTAWMYDGGLQLGVPLAGRGLSPFLQIGAGAMRHDIDIGPVSTHSTAFTANVGLGADVRLAPSVGLRLLARDYIGKFDFKEATMLDLDGKTSHNVALTAGVSLRF